jgi:hypothetical protein
VRKDSRGLPELISKSITPSDRSAILVSFADTVLGRVKFGEAASSISLVASDCRGFHLPVVKSRRSNGYFMSRFPLAVEHSLVNRMPFLFHTPLCSQGVSINCSTVAVSTTVSWYTSPLASRLGSCGRICANVIP